MEGQKLDLEGFAQFLDVPVSDMLRDMFALFDEVKKQTHTKNRSPSVIRVINKRYFHNSFPA